MAFSRWQRRIALATALILTLAAVAWVGKDENSVAPVVSSEQDDWHDGAAGYEEREQDGRCA